jgi:hypothetical protein
MNSPSVCLPPERVARCRRRTTWFLFLALLVFHLGFQAMHGAWTSDLGGDPDEASHAVTSLMLRDCLIGGWQQSPQTFAQNYYAAFPKVALGHYPPGYYLLAGLWLLPCASIKSLFVLQCVLAAALGTLIYRLASRMLPVPAALAAGLLSGVLPFTLKQAQFVMSDLLLGVLCLTATMAWSDYLCRPTKRRALAFGLLAAFAILTKGSALALCLVPPVATILAGRWRLIKQPSWWLSALPVALLAGPWMLFTSHITSEGLTHQPLLAYVKDAVLFYSTSMPQVLGWPLFGCFLVGLALILRNCVRTPQTSALLASIIGLLAGTTAVCLFIPTGLSTRYLLPVIPVLLIASVTAVNAIGSRLGKARWLAFYAIMLAAFSMTPRWPEKQVSGFSAAVMTSGVPQREASPQSWLVAADPRGEGAVIAAAAFNCPQRSPSLLHIYRGSKELSTSDWLGRGYTLTFADESNLLSHLDERKIRRIFIDLSGESAQRKEHEAQLRQALDHASDRWTLDFVQPIMRSPAASGEMLVYKRR